jgi:hypothetical protein
LLPVLLVKELLVLIVGEVYAALTAVSIVRANLYIMTIWVGICQGIVLYIAVRRAGAQKHSGQGSDEIARRPA